MPSPRRALPAEWRDRLGRRWRELRGSRWGSALERSRQAASTALDARTRRAVAVLERRWLALLAVLAAAVQATGLLRVLPGQQPPPLKDSIIFEYYGWFLTRGGRLYLDMWELKPPLNYQTTALFAVLVGGDPYRLHYLSVLATAGAAVGAALLAGLLVVEVTGDRLAGLAGGLAVFAHPVFFMRPAYGFKSKFFVVLAGLAAVYLVLRDRHALAGAAAAAATAYWQLGIVFPLVVLGLAGRRDGRGGVARAAVGGAALATLTLAPVVARGGLVAMLAETVVAPLHVGSTQPFQRRLSWLVELLGVTRLTVVLGAVGTVGLLRTTEDRRHWWLPAIVAWFLGHLLFLNVDYFGDLVPLVASSAVGVGVLAGSLRGVPARSIEAAVAGLVLVNAVALGGVPGVDPHPTKPRQPVKAPAEVDAPYFIQERRALMFHEMEPGRCHVFASKRQRAWIEATGGTHDADVCGRLPPDAAWIRSAVPAPLRGPPPGGGPIDLPPEDDPEPPPRAAVVVDGLRLAENASGALVVVVPLLNEGDRPTPGLVVVEAAAGPTSANRTTASRRKSVWLAPGERRTLRFALPVDASAAGIGVDVTVEGVGAG